MKTLAHIFIPSKPPLIMLISQHHTWKYLMKRALLKAYLASQKGEVPVAALIIDKQHNILALEANDTQHLHDPSAHAEILAIRTACARLKQKRLDNTTILVTLEPCIMCAAAIAEAHCQRLVFGAYDVKAGAVTHGVQLFNLPHKPPIDIIGGVLEREASLMLRLFFNTIRKK